MGRVHILDAALANQIAAGEVVERPSSAAKELLENAIDAGATAITVEIVDGGVKRLAVTDNGQGMSREDALLAVQRHATSKLTDAAQLSNLTTLGFRGEALPSIASVSRFSLRTREPEAVGAVKLRIEGGGAPEVSDAAGPQGTEIVVEDLFFNMPARLKFLKKQATEAAHVLETVQRLSLCAPEVAFRLVRDGRKVLDIPRHERLADRARALFGPRQTKNLVPVSLPGAWSIQGLVGPPSEARATTRHYHTFINGRFVRDRVVMGAVQAAYRGLLERGRHPFVILHLRIPPGAVDVNVHPAKTEVRFVNSGEVHRLVLRGVENALREATWQPERAPTVAVERRVQPTPDAPALGGLDAHRRRIFDVMERVASRRGGQPRSVPRPAHLRDAAPQPSLPRMAPPRPVAAGEPAPVAAPEPTLPALGPGGGGAVPLTDLAPLGAVAGFILCAAADGVVAVDVRAAARLIAYDAMVGQPPAELTPPRSVTLTAGELKRLAVVGDRLRAVGFTIQPFGGDTVVVERAPRGVGDVPRALRTALEAAPDDDLAWRLAEQAGDEAPPRAHRALLAALAAVERQPEGSHAVLTMLTAAELQRRAVPLGAK